MATCDRCGIEAPSASLRNADTFLFCTDREACTERKEWSTRVREAEAAGKEAMQEELFDATERIKHLESELAQKSADVDDARQAARNMLPDFWPTSHGLRDEMLERHPWLMEDEG